jgi:hypothetical protein
MKNLKAGEYVEMYGRKIQAIRARRQAQNEDNAAEDIRQMKIAREIEQEIDERTEKVNIKFWIGYRDYYQEVVKIGKGYYNRGEKMTKTGGGYEGIEEIPAITDQMKQEMIADSYYY